MPVAIRIGAALDWRVGGDRIGARIAFLGVFERDRHFLLVAADHDVRDTDRHSLPLAAEIGMQRLVQPDPGEDRFGVWIDRRAGNVLVPGAVARQQPSAVKIGVRTEFHTRIFLRDRTAKEERANKK